MKLFSCLCIVTIVRAAPIPMTEFLESSARAINKSINSILDSICTSCVIQSDIEEIIHSPLSKKQRLDIDSDLENHSDLANDQIAAISVPPEAQVKAPIEKSLTDSSAVNPDEPPVHHLDSNLENHSDLANEEVVALSVPPEVQVKAPIEKSLIDSPITNPDEPPVRQLDSDLETHIDDPAHNEDTAEVDAELDLAILNAIESSSKSSTGRKKATIDQVNQIWGVNVNNEASTPKSKSIKFSPHLTTHDRQSLLELERNLLLARVNAFKLKLKSTTPRLTTGEINEIWNNEHWGTKPFE